MPSSTSAERALDQRRVVERGQPAERQHARLGRRRVGDTSSSAIEQRRVAALGGERQRDARQVAPSADGAIQPGARPARRLRQRRAVFAEIAERDQDRLAHEALVVGLRLRRPPAEAPGRGPAQRAHEAREGRARMSSATSARSIVRSASSISVQTNRLGVVLQPQAELEKRRHRELAGAHRRPGVADDAEALALGQAG